MKIKLWRIMKLHKPKKFFYQFAQEMEIPVSRLYQIAHGTRRPNEIEVIKLQEYFDESEAELLSNIF